MGLIFSDSLEPLLWQRLLYGLIYKLLLPVDRKSGQRALDELQRTIIEIETKFKAEISRLKKKYDTEIREYEIQVETLSRANNELSKANKNLNGKVKVSIAMSRSISVNVCGCEVIKVFRLCVYCIYYTKRKPIDQGHQLG